MILRIQMLRFGVRCRFPRSSRLFSLLGPQRNLEGKETSYSEAAFDQNFGGKRPNPFGHNSVSVRGGQAQHKRDYNPAEPRPSSLEVVLFVGYSPVNFVLDETYNHDLQSVGPEVC